jgi:ATP-dependent exoDNAse (exonuclease V) beta subunit
MQSPLKVYKASAGSGKTFTLAAEYIKLLVANPTAYRHILAVTFTKKATAEMKERILSQLYGISHALPSSNGYFAQVCAAFPELSHEEIRKRTATALEMMLHDFSHFRIQTIDSFFQTILRGLARELELSGDVGISIDGEKLLEEAVDKLIQNLKPNSKEMIWVAEYIEEHLSEDKKWNVSYAIKKFATHILSEEYQDKGEELRKQIEANNGALLVNYRNIISSIEREIINEAKSYAERFFAISNGAGLTEDSYFQKKSGVWGFFKNLEEGKLATPNSYVDKCVESPEKLSKDKALTDSARQEIVSLVQKAKKLYDEKSKTLNSCRLSLKRFHQLRLLNSIAKLLQEENNKENRFMLAQTSFLLSKMITGNTSFIFEKISTEIHHIFIDEFQDTSSLQWKNFKVLLLEMISRNNMSLIVGDVKQSIYRWRNSDWSILNNLEKEFPHHPIVVNKLDTNRRSERHIIQFNNELFTHAAQEISAQYKNDLRQSGQELERAYEDVSQGIPEDRPQRGYVEVRMINGKKGELTANIHEQLRKTLDKLLNKKGVKASDITILVRNNDHITSIVEMFDQNFPNHKIISDDAYKLCSSTALNIIIAALRYISTPEDKINAYYLASRHSYIINGTEILPDELVERKDISTLLPQQFMRHIEELRKKPLYEILERIIELLELSKIENEGAYIYSFLDYVAKFQQEKPANIEELLNYWDEELCDKSIPASENDGVRIMTIHKSKGLEFHTVIIPFCTWPVVKLGKTTLWCTPKEEPFNEISLLPIEFQKITRDSIYEAEYNHEYLFQLVDNLNLLYVACTRAGKNLFIFSDAQGSSNSISQYLQPLIEKITLDGAAYNKEEQKFTYGEIVPSEEKEENKNDNPFISTPVSHSQAYLSYDNKLTFKQSKNLKRFLAHDKSEKQTLEYIARGELLHELLSHLRTGKELTRQLKKMQLQGIIGTDKEYRNIEKLISTALDNPQAADWFNGKYKLYNECTILNKNSSGNDKRPDRVMVNGDTAIVVDFKFGKPQEAYIRQVEEYKSLLHSMGYKNIKGYLWYIYTNKIEEV